MKARKRCVHCGCAGVVLVVLKTAPSVVFRATSFSTGDAEAVGRALPCHKTLPMQMLFVLVMKLERTLLHGIDSKLPGKQVLLIPLLEQNIFPEWRIQFNPFKSRVTQWEQSDKTASLRSCPMSYSSLLLKHFAAWDQSPYLFLPITSFPSFSRSLWDETILTHIFLQKLLSCCGYIIAFMYCII